MTTTIVKHLGPRPFDPTPAGLRRAKEEARNARKAPTHHRMSCGSAGCKAEVTFLASAPLPGTWLVYKHEVSNAVVACYCPEHAVEINPYFVARS